VNEYVRKFNSFNDLRYIFAVYPLQCYECRPKKPDVNYTMAQCEMEQMKVSCPANRTQCATFYKEEEHGGETIALRGCASKKECSDQKEYCADKKRKKEDGTTVCLVTCCESDGDTPCNGDTPKNSALAGAGMLITMTAMIAIHIVLYN